jgi:hypothetical protein
MSKAIFFRGSGRNDDANARYFLGDLGQGAEGEAAGGSRVTAAFR